MAKERLQKILARAGYGSRRSNEGMIEAGRVRVNGKVAKLGDSADSSDKVTVDGDRVKIAPVHYIMLNKPKGILSSTEDERGEGRATIRDFVDIKGHLYPVGRLDKQSEGLILLTNDGELAHRLTHPRYEHPKTYQVWVTGRPSEKTLREWSKGVMLEDKKTAPADVQFVAEEGVVSQLRIVMREGRKRQIRRVANVMGHTVTRLIRKQIGSLHIGDLAQGRWRHLTDEELAGLRKLMNETPRRKDARRPASRGRRSSNRPKYGRSSNDSTRPRRDSNDESKSRRGSSGSSRSRRGSNDSSPSRGRGKRN